MSLPSVIFSWLISFCSALNLLISVTRQSGTSTHTHAHTLWRSFNFNVHLISVNLKHKNTNENVQSQAKTKQTKAKQKRKSTKNVEKRTNKTWSAKRNLNVCILIRETVPTRTSTPTRLRAFPTGEATYHEGFTGDELTKPLRRQGRRRRRGRVATGNANQRQRQHRTLPRPQQQQASPHLATADYVN